MLCPIRACLEVTSNVDLLCSFAEMVLRDRESYCKPIFSDTVRVCVIE